MCLLSLTAPDSNFRFHVKRVDNAVSFPVLDHASFGDFTSSVILSVVHFHEWGWIIRLTFSKGERGLGAVYLTSLFKELAFMLVYTRCSGKYISEVMIKGICTILHMCN